MLTYRTDSLVPLSNAQNAYDLLADVITVIREEPNRFNWTDWKMRAVPERAAFDARLPACGTIGCVGGWCSILKGAVIGQVFSFDVWNELQDLFYAEPPYTGFVGDGYLENEPLDPQEGESQKGYAERAIRAIELFMKDHEELLKAGRLCS